MQPVDYRSDSSGSQDSQSLVSPFAGPSDPCRSDTGQQGGSPGLCRSERKCDQSADIANSGGPATSGPGGDPRRSGTGTVQERLGTVPGLCRSERKYHFTPGLLEELRLAYCGNKNEVSANLNRLARRMGWPKYAFKTEARRQGWSADYRPWTQAEDAFLREHIDDLSVRAIAKRLGRSSEAIVGKLETILLLRQAREGYGIALLARLCGVGLEKVRRWVERGLFGRVPYRPEMRVPETGVLYFLRTRHSEYDLTRVHQQWFKALLFGERMEGV